MTHNKNGNAPVLAGERGVGKQGNADYASDNVVIGNEMQQKKPEIDLASWAALGKHAMPRHLTAPWRRGGAK